MRKGRDGGERGVGLDFNRGPWRVGLDVRGRRVDRGNWQRVMRVPRKYYNVIWLVSFV